MSDIENVEQFVGQLKVVELREELKKRQLPYAGHKKDLAQRLQEALLKEKEQQNEDEEEEEEEEEEAEAEEEESADAAEEGGEEEEAVEGESKEGEEEAEEQAPTEDTPQENGDKAEIPRIVETTSTTMEEPQPAEESETAEQEAEAETAEQEKEEETKEEEEEQQPSAVVTDGDGDQQAMETGGGEEEKKEDAAGEPETEQMESSGQEQDKDESKPDDKKESEGDAKEGGGGVKRQHEDDDATEEKTDKVDPSKAPDPEEPEKFDESALRNDIEEQFSAAEDDVTVTLDRYNSDLYFKINPDGLGGCNLSDHGFAYLWAAARATWGVKGGKYYFEVRVEENLEVELPETEEHPHAIRVGWSPDESELSLGEVPHSYGYGGTGRSSMNNKFETYGEPYGPGDVIGCFLDLESSPRTISFSKNGQYLETAFTLEEGELKDKALFPHVATKNVKMSLNFSSPAWSEVEGVEGYVPLQDATEEHKIRAIKGPTAASECEVLMMIGLPASGKTTWAEKHCRDHPEKRFNILGTNLIMDKMKVSGLARKQNYHGRWEALIKQSTEVLNAMFLLAGKNLRNYIIDQTNVYDGAQRRKMSYFEGFTKKAVVVVPPHHVLRQRTAKRNSEMGQPVPDDAINAMKANFHVPRKGGIFEDVLYAEIYGVAADKIVRQYREDALGLPSYPTTKRGRYDRSPSDRGGRFGSPRSGGRGGGYSPYPPYGRGPPYGYGYSRGPAYPPYHRPPPPPHHMYPPRGGYGGGGHYGHHSPYAPRPYGGRGGYGPPPHRGGGGGYYGRY